MHIKEELVFNSREQALRIAGYIGDDPVRFHELMKLLLGDNTREAQLAAMTAGICVDHHPGFIYPYVEPIIHALENPVHDAVVRCVLRMLQSIEIPEKHWGRAWDICFKLLASGIQPVAIRVNAMTTLANICVHYPELKFELQSLIEDHLPYSSAGFQSRAKKVLKKLNSI